MGTNLRATIGTDNYRGQQWTARPNLSPSTPRRATGHLNTLNGGTRGAVGKQEMPIQARPDWVKEWQALSCAHFFGSSEGQ